MKDKKPAEKYWNGMTVAMRTKLARRMHLTVDDLQEAQLYIEEAIYQTKDNIIRQAAIWQYVALAHQFNNHLAPYNTLLKQIEGNPWHRTIDGDMRAFRCYANHYNLRPQRLGLRRPGRSARAWRGAHA
jgi:hypothetical protein